MFIEQLDRITSRLTDEFSTAHKDSDWALRTGLDQLLQTLTSARVNSTDRTHLAAMAYASRTMQLSHAAIGSIRSGNIASAQVLTRVALEALFALSALAHAQNFEDGKDFYLSLLYKSTHTRLAALKRYLKCANLTDERRAQAQAKIAKEQALLSRYQAFRLTTVREVAEAALMSDVYDRDYAYHSSPCHSDLEDVLLNHVTEVDGKFQLKGFAVDHEQSQVFSAHLLFVILEAAVAIEHLFQVELSDTDRQTRDELAYFYGSTLIRATSPESPGADRLS